ncbi:hypothetical protein [Tautonia plasticadhaerens]|uniref:hypothetical protein n=1 Tax=Tautonia plasticadhaerens TaxID=2527974 RepID=UPI0011A32010|nr:hypothetical protein [Tautonia plasticadhaerens]
MPWLTSLYHNADAGIYGNRNYRGNCSGNLIRDLILYFQPESVLDVMSGSGTAGDVCRSLGIPCYSGDLRTGLDACNAEELETATEGEVFDFAWIHPPYWRMIAYSNDPRDLSAQPTLTDFVEKLKEAMQAIWHRLSPGGKLAVLIGDYNDRELGFLPLTYLTKQAAFSLGYEQRVTDIIRFSHGSTSSRRRYNTAFIPGLHDTCVVFEKPEAVAESQSN